MKPLLYFFLFLLLLGSCGETLKAQYTSAWGIKLMEPMNAQCIVPKNYSVEDSNFIFSCNDIYISPTIHYTIMRKDGNILIGMTFNRYPTAKEIHQITLARSTFDQYKSYNIDSSIIHAAEVRADTVHHKIIYYSYDEVNQMYNADCGVEYTRNCTCSVNKIFNHNRIVWISKKGRGNIEINFLYTNNISDKEIEHEIEALEKKNLLKFNEL